MFTYLNKSDVTRGVRAGRVIPFSDGNTTSHPRGTIPSEVEKFFIYVANTLLSLHERYIVSDTSVILVYARGSMQPWRIILSQLVRDHGIRGH